MEILLLHLTDMHFQQEDNWISYKTDKIISAIKDDIVECSIIYFLLTGDISFSGKKEEFSKAFSFLSGLKSEIIKLKSDIRFKVVATSGNHDCNFNYETQVRKTLVNQMSYDTIGKEDFSVIDICLKVQDDYWEFNSLFHSAPLNKMLYNVRNKIDSFTIGFQILNSSWMSQLEEEAGKLFFPIKLYSSCVNEEPNDVNITILHHPITWYNPKTGGNNRKELQDYLECTSDIIIYGHEHIEDHTKKQSLKTNNETLYISGNALQPDDNSESGFQLITLHLENREIEISSFKWTSDLFVKQPTEKATFRQSRTIQSRFLVKDVFYNKITKIPIPISIETSSEIILSDIFVYPDLDCNNKDIDDLFEYCDSAELADSNEKKYTIVEGASQSGKTSLLQMLYIDFFEKGLIPLLIDGGSIRNPDPDHIIKRAFQRQYEMVEKDFERFRQAENQNKILLIDNLHNVKFSSSVIIDLLEKMTDRFGRIVVATNSTYSLLSKMKSGLKEFQYYVLKPLGYQKRDMLIKNYHRLNSDFMIEDPEIIFERTKVSFDKVETILGNKLMPSYPIFVLSILQALDYGKPLDLKQTSYGYCYESLIYLALSQRAKIPNDDIDTYINVITELAYNLFERGIKELSETDFKEFYQKYGAKYLSPDQQSLLDNLLKSNILFLEDGYLRFGYVYIYYFLVAKKIAEIINTNRGKEILSDLYSAVYEEVNANILVFLTHHSKDDFFIESATFSSMLPFEDQSPITLEKNGEYYKLIEQIAEEVSTDIIVAHKNPEEERANHLNRQDEIDHRNNAENYDEEPATLDEEMKPFYLAFRSMEIVGQIIKNRKGSIEKDKLVEMISELYFNGFRTVNYFGRFISEAKEEFVESLLDDVGESDTEQEIREKINTFFQFISLQTCLSMFTKIVHSVGVKELRTQYDDVAKKIGTPAAKLVSFSIKSYYDRMSIRELQKLAKEFRGNPVAMFILKSRVRSYLYNNYIDYKSRNKIIQALNMKVLPPASMKKRS